MLALRDGQRRGDNPTAGMKAGRVRVIGLIRMTGHPVGKRRVGRRGSQAAADDRGLRCATLESHVVNGTLTGVQRCARNHGRERVE